MRYNVIGMHCASCAATIEKTVKKQPGVKDISVNYGTEQAHIDFDNNATTLDALSKTIEPFGYRFEAPAPAEKTQSNNHGDHGGNGTGKEEHDHMKMDTAGTLKHHVRIAIPLVIITSLIMTWDILIDPLKILPSQPEWIMELFHHLLPLFATYMLFIVGTPYLRGVWTFIKHRVANMDTLIGIGTLTAFLYSFIISTFEEQLKNILNTEYTYYDVTIVVIGLITLGKYLEANAKRKTGDAIKKLIGLQVKTALVVRDGKEQELPVDQVVHGDMILVRPGMKIPVDGVIVEGESHIDESMLTGEPIPAGKNMNDTVAAGTINTTGSFTMKATGVGKETLLAHIITMVEDAQGSKAPIQKLADKISAIFVPIVLVIAALSFILWLWIGGNYMPLSQALSFALVSFVGVLVIACPCALGLATPTAIIVGVGKGAVNGILIKNAEVLETLHKVTTLVIDKTGTLTEGKPTLISFEVQGDMKEEDAFSILASLEKQSEHPLGQSILKAANERKISFSKVSEFKNIPGKGVRGVINGTTYYAGGPALLDELHINTSKEKLTAIAKEGKTPIVLADKDTILAIAAIGDTIKSNAKDAIKKLHDMGIEIIMATGDHKDAAETIAKDIGINDVIAQVLPEDKLKKIKELQTQGKVVAMAGDGVNDAPALAQADVGLAMSTGTDVSIETGDVTLLHGDIEKIADAIRLSRMTMTTIKQNLFFAFIYNVIGIPIASGIFYPVLGWLLSPVFAGFAMALSSVSVVTNSLRLKTKKL